MRHYSIGAALRLADFAFALCPPRWRFPAALRLSEVSRPLLKRLPLYRPTPTCLDGAHGHQAVMALSRLTRRHIEFQPAVTLRGADALGTDGAILVTAHIYLNLLFLRWLHDRGRKVSLVMADPTEFLPVIGPRAPFEVINGDSKCFFRIRRRVAEGYLVTIAIDYNKTSPGARPVQTPYGAVYVSDAIFRFAQRAGLPVRYFTTHLTKDGQVVTDLARPSEEPSGSLDEFCRLLEAHIDRVEW